MIGPVWVGAVALGLAYAGVAIGIWISFRVLNFPDLTVDGSFPVGAAVSATLIVRGWDPWLTLAPAMAAGGLAGLVTGLLGTRLRINGLLAGILVSIGLWTVNLRVMNDRANVPLLNTPNVIQPVRQLVNDPNWSAVVLFGALALALAAGLTWFFSTELGLAIRAAGDNERMVRAQALDADGLKLIGLSLSNGLVALAGALVAQYQGFADAGMGLGMIVAGLASVIIGETLLRPRGLLPALVGVIFGSIVYRLAVAAALVAGLAPTDMRLATALIVILALSVPQLRRWLRLPGSAPAARRREAPGL